MAAAPALPTFACCCCGEGDVREACELCSGPVCGDCCHVVKGDVLLCLRCTDVLGPCAVCDGPTSAPLEAEEEEEEGGAVATYKPTRGAGTGAPPTYCPNCTDLYCLACTSRAGTTPGHPLCPYCEVPLQPRPDPDEEEEEAEA
jgi:hypothetical protein